MKPTNQLIIFNAINSMCHEMEKQENTLPGQNFELYNCAKNTTTKALNDMVQNLPDGWKIWNALNDGVLMASLSLSLLEERSCPGTPA